MLFVSLLADAAPCDLPAEADVRLATQYDNGARTGTMLAAPAVVAPTRGAGLALQLILEKALAAFIEASGALPAGVGVHFAHGVQNVSGEYVAVIAGLPDWETYGGVNALVRITFQLVTSVADPDNRPTASEDHQERLGGIIDLFSDALFDDTRDALNAGAEPVRFTGWEESHPDSADGRNDEAKLLAPRLEYDFVCFTVPE